MAEGVRRGPLGEARAADGLDHGALHDGLVQMMTTALTRRPVEVEPGGREDPLPRPLAASVRVLAGQGAPQLDPAGTLCQVGFVLLPPPLQGPAGGRADR